MPSEALAKGGGVSATLLVLLWLSQGVPLHAQGGGPLLPPGAPEDNVYRTALEIEPRIPISEAGFVITEPGSYYLTKNIAGEAGKNGIEIHVGKVTLDLSGFILSGTGVAGTFNGIKVVGGQELISMRNGVVTGWPRAGIDASDASHVTIEAVKATLNGKEGISAGKFAQISGCKANSNGTAEPAAGIVGVEGCTVTNCTANGNSGCGIGREVDSVLSECVTKDNGRQGVWANNSRIENCVSISNGRSGVEYARGFQLSGCTVAGCVSRNQNQNFYSSASLLTACTSMGESTGFDLQSSVVRRCLSQFGVHGFLVRDSGCQVDQCTIRSCDIGITIWAGDGSHIVGNRVMNDPDYPTATGIEVLTAGNVITGNTVTGSPTGYDIVSGNQVGPILTDMATATSPFSNFDL